MTAVERRYVIEHLPFFHVLACSFAVLITYVCLHRFGTGVLVQFEDFAVTKSFFWDTLNIDWCSVKLYMSNQVIQLPKSVAIPMKHKIKTRRLMSGEGMDIQFMIKQGSTWYNLTNTAQWNRSAGKSCSYASCKQHDPSAKIRSSKPVEV